MLPQVERPGTIEKIVTALQAVLKFLATFETPREWQLLPLFADWNYGTAAAAHLPLTAPQYVLNPLSRVELAGSVYSASATSTIAVLPIGCRPKATRAFPVAVVSAGNAIYGEVSIRSDGRVVLITPVPAAGIEVHLDGINFDTRV